MSTTLQLVDRIRILMVNRGSREQYTDADIISIGVNPVAREVAAVSLNVTKSTSFTLQSGVQDYSFPNQLVPFIRVALITIGSEKKRIYWRTNDDVATITYSGDPIYWTVWNDKIRFAPTPDTTGRIVNLDAYGGPVPCVEQSPAASSDELLYTSDAEDAVVYGAARIFQGIDREPERYAAYDQEYKNKIEQLRQKLAPDGESMAVIRDRFTDDIFFFTA